MEKKIHFPMSQKIEKMEGSGLSKIIRNLTGTHDIGFEDEAQNPYCNFENLIHPSPFKKNTSSKFSPNQRGEAERLSLFAKQSLKANLEGKINLDFEVLNDFYSKQSSDLEFLSQRDPLSTNNSPCKV